MEVVWKSADCFRARDRQALARADPQGSPIGLWEAAGRENQRSVQALRYA